MNSKLYVLGIDPGSVHVGVARYWLDEIITWELRANIAPQELHLKVRQAKKLGFQPVLVIEEFVLYPDRSEPQAWQQMTTSEMIGALKYICHLEGIEYAEQGANVKIPTRKQLKAMGIRQVGSDIHERDAELHLYRYLMRKGLIECTPAQS